MHRAVGQESTEPDQPWAPNHQGWVQGKRARSVILVAGRKGPMMFLLWRVQGGPHAPRRISFMKEGERASIDIEVHLGQ